MHAKLLHDSCCRDIKPSNFLVRTLGSTKAPAVISDFGLSEWWRKGTKGPQDGTVLYQPPEVHRVSGFADFSPSTDVFALSCTLWQVLTRQNLYSQIFEQFSHSKTPISLALDQIRKLVPEGERPDDWCLPWAATNRHEVKFLEVVKHAWAQEPAQRPNAADIYAKLMTIKRECQDHLGLEQSNRTSANKANQCERFSNPLASTAGETRNSTNNSRERDHSCHLEGITIDEQNGRETDDHQVVLV